MKLVNVWRTIRGGNPAQRAWVRAQVDERGRLPPFQDRVGNAIFVVAFAGILVTLALWIFRVPVSVRGPLAIVWGLVGAAFAVRQYRWLHANPEFQALATAHRPGGPG